MKRRKFLKMMATGVATPLVVSGCEDLLFNPRLTGSILPLKPGQDDELAYSVFDLSVASGDPSEDGIILWTHIDSSAVVDGASLWFEVSTVEDFSDIIITGEVAASDINVDRDYTVSINLEGQLYANRLFYYRFVYDGVVSRTGRCRTLPSQLERLEEIKFALCTCQDYTNGYYGAYNYIAGDDDIDYVIHLGDFIYESAGDPRFQSLPFEDRSVILPSGGGVALDVEDFRAIYKTIRSDRNLQLAAERHTFIIVPDDHETANDCYWDYERDTLGAPDHPFVHHGEYGNDPDLLKQLKLDSQRAWAEYTPSRVVLNESADHPHEFSTIYRDFSFGDLVDLYMLDTRTYRSAHPCGEGDYFERYASVNCEASLDTDRTILGDSQREWLKNGVINSNAVWPVLGNQCFMGRLGIASSSDPAILDFNVDAWDGYKAERNQLLRDLRNEGVRDLIVLTGDLHSYIASELKLNFEEINPFDITNYVGAEFMTPSITSSGLSEILLKSALDNNVPRQRAVQAISRSAIQVTNPHIRFFDSTQHGYSTVSFTRDWCEWRAYVVDKNNNTEDNARHEIYNCKKFKGVPWLM